MEIIFSSLSPLEIAFAISVGLLAGFVKGAIGFALPMILVSGLATVLPANLAISALIVPTVVSNLWQSLRGGGLGAALDVARRFKLFIGTLMLVIVITAQLVAGLNSDVILLVIGVPIVALSLLILSGRKFTVAPEKRGAADVAVGTAAGFLGGLAGIWGPLTVIYLTALDTPKKDQIRLTGVVFGVGAIVLGFSHLSSGLLNSKTLPLSLFMVFPALIGQTLGNKVQDRLDQKKFKKLTLLVLIVAGLNLIRRGLM